VNGAGDLGTALPDAWPMLKRHGKTFAWAAHLLPRRDADRLAQLYTICRRLDDLADLDGSADARGRLLDLRANPWKSSSTDPMARELATMVADMGLNPAAMQQLLDGLISDLGPQIIADEVGLIGYAYLVAGTVGLMVCDVLEVKAPTARKAAVNLGIAMQLTNIARDVHEDAVAGRRYLPATWWDAAPADITAPSPDMQRKGAAAVLRLLDLADGYYASAQCGFAFLPLSSRIGLAVAARVYRGIGAELRRRGGAFHQGRVYVPRWRKAVLTVAAIGSLASPNKPIADLNLHPVILDPIPPASKAAINGRC
jgi:15-cis-phytoene synthase